MSREFFTARTVGEALAGFRPTRRTAVETVGLAEALHRVPAADVPAPAAMPGFARSTVDGYAVRAADTYGASEGLPCYLDLAGAEVRVLPQDAEVLLVQANGVLEGDRLAPGIREDGVEVTDLA